MTVTSKVSLWGRALREPLLHFLALGAIVFAVDYAVASKEDDPSAIRMSRAVDAELKDLFRDGRGKDPGDEELEALRQRWLDNEVLYREGLALGLDRGDEAIRERVIFKALNVVQSNLALPDIDDAALREWFESRRSDYDTPARIDFLEAVVQGKPTVEEVAAFAKALDTGAATEIKSGLRVFKGRPQASVAESFGEDFATALEQLPIGEWRALASKEGPRAVRVEARTPGAAADFEVVRNEVLQDWKDRRMQELRTQAVRELATKYTLLVEKDPR